MKPALRSHVSDLVGVSFSTNEIESSTILEVYRKVKGCNSFYIRRNRQLK